MYAMQRIWLTNISICIWDHNMKNDSKGSIHLMSVAEQKLIKVGDNMQKLAEEQKEFKKLKIIQYEKDLRQDLAEQKVKGTIEEAKCTS